MSRVGFLNRLFAVFVCSSRLVLGFGAFCRRKERADAQIQRRSRRGPGPTAAQRRTRLPRKSRSGCR